MTKLERHQEEAQAYLDRILGTRYTWWRGGIVPPRGPAWGKNGKPPSPAEVRREGCFCAGVANLARRAVGLPIPTLGNPNYDGGVVAYFGATSAAPPDFPRQSYFEKHGKLRRFDLQKARKPWTLIGRKYRNVKDQGHVAIVIPGGKVLQSYDGGGGRPGVNKNVTLERSHAGHYYEVMVYAEDWLLPFGEGREEPRDDRGDDERPDRPKPQKPKSHKPKPDHADKPPDEVEPDEVEPDGAEPDREDREIPLFTARQLIQISGNPNLKPTTAEKYRKALTPEMRKAGVTTPLRMAAFFGNVMVETARLDTLEEYGGPNPEHYFRYGPPGGDGLYLGNQWRYHGRGFLMNTWKDAYANLSKVVGEDLVARPDLLERPEYAAKAALWFWKRHNLNAYADRREFKKVCAIINTGSEHGEPNHLAERVRFYDRAKRVLSNGPRIPAEPDRDGHEDRDERDERERAEQRRRGLNRDGLPYINLAAVGQADETAAFVLATEIRRAGIGVTVTTGADGVYALAEQIRPEPLGHRQLWIMGGPALEACGDYADLANWPASPKSDYYDLAGRSLTGTCRRAAEIADERARQGVGQRFLEEMGMAEDAPAEPPTNTLPPPRETLEEHEIRMRNVERNGGAPEDEDLNPTSSVEDQQQPEDDESKEPPSAEARTPEVQAGSSPGGPGGSGGTSGLRILIDGLRNNTAFITWIAGAVVAWLIGNGILAPELKEQTTADVIAGLLLVLGLLSRQFSYGPVTVEKNYRKKDE